MQKSKLHSFLLSLFFMLSILLPAGMQAQVSTIPMLPTADGQQVVITFDATQGGGGLAGYTGQVYTHTGVILEGSSSWSHVIGTWGDNNVQPQLTRIGPDLYELVIGPSVREFYGVAANQTIARMAFVFRAAGGSPQSEDLFVEIVPPGLTTRIFSPAGMQPIFDPGQAVEIIAAANESVQIDLYINDAFITASNEAILSYTWNESSTGRQDIRVLAWGADESYVEESTYFYVRSEVPVAALPEGVIPGINYLDDTSVTLVLHDPPALKQYVFAIGDFNDWEIDESNYMYRTPSGTHYWITLSNLVPGQEYAYQYLIDGELRLADPYTEKVLDPWHDHWIPEFNYPNLKPYPHGKTTGIASVFQTARPAFQWEATGFTPPAPEDMVIYELLIRDFIDTRAIITLMDSLDYLQNLGVNVIELMPINEFEGNDSWGYNPSFYFATDKAYGTREDYKRFIDECHKRGIAVVIDMVLNHSFGQSPLVQMYFDPGAGQWGQPLPENPWYNEVCPHPPYCWGYDFDHESPYTVEFVNRVNEYWLTEFRVDGFRFDFTKGFTNNSGGNEGWNYDADRIAILKAMADHVWSVNPDAYVILEHFAQNSEEKELAEYGMMLWGNMTHPYQEAAMGWTANSNFGAMSYQSRNWEVPHLIGYMESHDEERMMYKNKTYGNSNNPMHDVKDLTVGLSRAEAAAAFYFTIPGPKMIWQFGELGYDYSINHCPDGTIDNSCRTSAKPIRWDYYEDWRRKRLYDVYSLLANLKVTEAVFRTTEYSLMVSPAMKRIHLDHESNQVVVLGNFGIEAGQITPAFFQTGTWHEYFTRETLEVTDVNQPINLQPGEYRLYSLHAFEDHGIPLSSPVVADQKAAAQLRVYPIPSSGQVWFEVKTGQPGNLRLEIFDLNGRLVHSQQQFTTGQPTQIEWSGRGSNGQSLLEGMYFYRLSADDFSRSGSLMLR